MPADAALTWQTGNEIVASFCCVPLSAHPSVHLVIHPPAAEEKGWECEPPEAFRSALMGHHPASPKTSPYLTERLTSLCQHAAHSVTLRGCHTLDSRLSACVCIKQLCDTCIWRGEHGCFHLKAAC